MSFYSDCRFNHTVSHSLCLHPPHRQSRKSSAEVNLVANSLYVAPLAPRFRPEMRLNSIVEESTVLASMTAGTSTQSVDLNSCLDELFCQILIKAKGRKYGRLIFGSTGGSHLDSQTKPFLLSGWCRGQGMAGVLQSKNSSLPIGTLLPVIRDNENISASRWLRHGLEGYPAYGRSTASPSTRPS